MPNQIPTLTDTPSVKLRYSPTLNFLLEPPKLHQGGLPYRKQDIQPHLTNGVMLETAGAGICQYL